MSVCLSFKKYGYAANEDEPCGDIAALDLDKIEVAGVARPELLRSTMRFLTLALLLITDVSVFEGLFREKPSVVWGASTRNDFARHLSQLVAWGVLVGIKSGEAKFISPFFAVPKKNSTARAILNLRRLSRLQVRPPPTNLPEIPHVWRLLSEIHGRCNLARRTRWRRRCLCVPTCGTGSMKSACRR